MLACCGAAAYLSMHFPCLLSRHAYTQALMLHHHIHFNTVLVDSFHGQTCLQQ